MVSKLQKYTTDYYNRQPSLFSRKQNKKKEM